MRKRFVTRAAVCLTAAVLSWRSAVMTIPLYESVPVSAASARDWYQPWADVYSDGQFRYTDTDEYSLEDDRYGLILRECFGDEQTVRVPGYVSCTGAEPDDSFCEVYPVRGIEYDGSSILSGTGAGQRSLTVPKTVEWISLYDFSASDGEGDDPAVYCDLFTTLTILNPKCEIRIPRIREIVNCLHQRGLELTIRGEENSTAQRFAQRNGLPFEVAAGRTEGLQYGFDSLGMMIIGCETVSVPESVQIPESILGMPVTVIASDAFADCWDPEANYDADAVDAAEIVIPGSVREVQPRAFYGCRGFGRCAFQPGLKEIGDYAFAYSSLKEVKLPDTVERIGSRAFCSPSLTEFCLPASLTEIGNYALSESRIRSLEIPDGITEIPAGFCTGCTELQTVVLPSALRTVGEYAFAFTFSLRSVSIPQGCRSIGTGAFMSSALTELTLPDSVTECGAQMLGGAQICSLTLSAGMTEIPENFCSDCYQLRTVQIPDQITKIGDYAFAYCSALTELRLPAGLKEVGEEAFFSTALRSVEFPPETELLGDGVFGNCDALEEIIFRTEYFVFGTDAVPPFTDPMIYGYAAGSAQDFAAEYDLFFTDLETGGVIPRQAGILYGIRDGHAAVIGTDCGAIHQAVIAAEYEGLPVTEIDDGAFMNCAALQKAVLPDTVTAIGRGAFSNCTQLQAVDLPDGLKTIGDFAFESCIELEKIRLPDGLERIGAGAFCDCAQLTSADIPASVQALGERAFFQCEALKTLTLPEGLETIPQLCFCRTAVSVITVPASVKEIGRNAFSECKVARRDIYFLNPDCVMNECCGTYAHYGTRFFGYVDSTAHSYADWIGVPFYTPDGTRITAPAKDPYQPGQSISTEPYDETTGGGEYTCTSCTTYDWGDPGTSYTESYTTYGGGGGGTAYTESGSTCDWGSACTTCFTYDTGTSTDGPSELPGDVDCNHTVQIADAVLFMRVLAEDPTVCPSAQGFVNADMDGDGILTFRDSRALLLLLSGAAD